MQTLDTLFNFFLTLITTPRTGLLIVLLMVASVYDCRVYKIPNWLTASGTVFGLLYNTTIAFSPAAGFLWAFEGALLGLMIMLPLYALRAMGAGDVKLMAMVGAFLGVPDILYAIFCTFLVGGIAALGFAILKKALGRMLTNVKNIVQLMALSATASIKLDEHIEAGTSVGKLPYGVSISIGTIGYMVVQQLGYW